MSILSVDRLGMYYGAQDVFQDVTFDLARGDKVGLVGPNGAGKTTLLRIILGQEEPVAGAVYRARNLAIGYLPQRPTLESTQTLYGEMLAVFAELRRKQRSLQELAESLASAPDPTALMERYADAEHRFEMAGGYEYENRIARVLGGLGFSADQYEWPISVLSGGQVTRALLARLLLQEPELLILDEPTNYLDIEALEWLESYLGDWKGSILVVSHDRFFLDRVVTRILELNRGRLEAYRGNYSSYLDQREARRERQMREYQEQQEFIAKTEEYIRRNKAGQRSREAKGRQTRLDRMERIERPQENKRMSLRLSTNLRAGDKVLTTEGAIIGYPSRPEERADDARTEHRLLQTGEILVQRGQRIAMLGPNGSGKTTFLRTILGEVQPLAGKLRIGASVRIGYLPQTQDWLDAEKTVLDHVLDASRLLIGPARTHLGRFLFSGDDVYKKVGTLSGGERSRLALAILTLRGANVLLLDEPTTHLDLDSQEVLQDVLLDFPGTILMVSHDRYLIDALATHIWMVEDRTISQHEGNYSDYVAAHEALKASAAQAEAKAAASAPTAERRARRDDGRKREERASLLEEEIARIEERMEAVSRGIDQAGLAQDLDRVVDLGREYEDLERALASRLHEWEAALTDGGRAEGA
jgi:ATP-binding cassette subfamily F protein 3